ncbi:MAG: outer membrane protein assembly factor BamD, partial [Bdellovibrionota bacterium]
MNRWLLIILVISSIWGCTSTEKNENTPEGLFKQGQEFIKDERYDLAIQRFQDVKNKFPYSALATQSELEIADAYFKQESFAEAQIAYQGFRDLHPKHPKIDYVIYQLGMSYFKQLPSTNDRDLTLALDAIRNFQEVLSRFPTSE